MAKRRLHVFRPKIYLKNRPNRRHNYLTKKDISAARICNLFEVFDISPSILVDFVTNRRVRYRKNGENRRVWHFSYFLVMRCSCIDGRSVIWQNGPDNARGRPSIVKWEKKSTKKMHVPGIMGATPKSSATPFSISLNGGLWLSEVGGKGAD